MTRLHEAAAAGDIDKVQEYLSAGDEVNDMSGIVNSKGKKAMAGDGDWGRNMTPLHLAAYHGHIEVVRILTAAGAHLEQRDAWRSTAFQMALGNRFVGCARVLKELGAIDHANGLATIFSRIDINDWLTHAAIYKKASIIVELHTEGLITKEAGEKTLRQAAQYNAVAVAEALLKHCDVSPDAYDDSVPMTYGSGLDVHKTPLGIAAEHGHYEIAKLLLEAGAAADKYTHTTTQQSNCTPLREAVIHIQNKKSNAKLIELLLTYGADVNKINEIGLRFLLEKGFADELELLLNHGLDANLILDDKPLLVHCIRGYERHELAITLINHGADVRRVDDRGQNYLHKSDNLKLTRLLVEQGVDFMLPDLSGKTPIEYVDHASAVYLAKRGAPLHSFSLNDHRVLSSTKLLQMVVEANHPNINQPDSKGMTPVRQLVKSACLDGYLENLTWILQNVPDVNLDAIGSEGGWTALHEGFAQNQGFVNFNDDESDRKSVAKSKYTKAIDLLIASGAKPLKDAAGRTPLMCMTFNGFSSSFNWAVIDRYYKFEAAFYGVDPDVYKKEFIKLRQSGFGSIKGLLSAPPTYPGLFDSVSVPKVGAIDRFWSTIDAAKAQSTQAHTDSSLMSSNL